MTQSDAIVDKKYGIVFPGCGVAFTGSEKNWLENAGYDIEMMLSRAEKVCCLNKPLVLQACSDTLLADELQAQFAAYIYSCAMSDVIVSKGIETLCCAGYSMGLYAALYHARSIRFEDGLRLIECAYQALCKSFRNEKWKIAVILGLNRKNLNELICQSALSIEVINENSEIGFVVTGTQNEVDRMIHICEQEGALKTVCLPLSIPYHSVKAKAALPEFEKVFRRVTINAPANDLYSCVNQQLVCSRDAVHRELTQNLSTAISWLRTMQLLLGKGVKSFIECGPGESLTRAGKFIDGCFKMFNSSNLKRIVE